MANDFDAFIAHLEKLKKINRRKILKKTAARVIEKLVEHEDQGLSYRDLSRLGHPYSKANPNPSYDPALASAHDYQLIEGWTTQAKGRDQQVYNTSEHAELMEKGGSPSSLMTTRPLLNVLDYGSPTPEDMMIEEIDAELNGSIK